MAEKMLVNGREVVQMPFEEYQAIVDFISDEKKRKNDLYQQRIDMAEEYVISGKPSVDPQEMFKRCRDRAVARRGNVANG